MQATPPLHSNPNAPPVVPGMPNPNDTEYRVTVKQKKKQTAACDACKRRRRKCSGTLPCAYCAEKKCECNYSQQHKRGKRKAADIQNPDSPEEISTTTLAKANKLWNEAERYGAVDKFCGIRWWFTPIIRTPAQSPLQFKAPRAFSKQYAGKNLLDMQGIKQSPSPAHRAQYCIINAWMARLARDHATARHYFDIARNISLNGFGDSDAVSTTTAYLLMSDYAPSEKEYCHYSWKSARHIKPGTATERHVYFYASSFQAFNSDTQITYKEMHDRLISFGSTAMQSSVVDLWDTVYFMSVKAYLSLMVKLESYFTSGYLRTISNLRLEPADKDALMMDLRVGEVLMQSQMHMFGFEYSSCLQFTKLVLLWAGGERDKAVAEAIRYVQQLEQYGENALFLVEVKNLMMPLMILNAAGITQYNNTTVGIIEAICKETDQPDMLAELIPLFTELRLVDSTPLPANHPLANRSTPSALHSAPHSAPFQRFPSLINPLSVHTILNPDPNPHSNSSSSSNSNSISSSTSTATTSTPSPPQDDEIYNPPSPITAAGQHFFAEQQKFLRGQDGSQSRDPTPSPSYSQTPSPYDSPLSNSSSSYSSPQQPQQQPSHQTNPYLQNNSPETHSSPPFDMPSPPRQQVVPSNYVPPINQPVPSNLHQNHPLMGGGSYYISPTTPFVTFPFASSHITQDLNWIQPLSLPNTPTPYADALLSGNASYPHSPPM